MLDPIYLISELCNITVLTGDLLQEVESFSVQSCTKLAMVCATRDKAGTKEFITSLTKVAPSLGMTMNKPKMFPCQTTGQPPTSRLWTWS